jgi:hypothetical protein
MLEVVAETLILTRLAVDPVLVVGVVLLLVVALVALDQQLLILALDQAVQQLDQVMAVLVL